MGFQLSGLFQGMDGTGKTGTARTGSASGALRPPGGESALKAGQTFSGEVIAKNGSEVQIRLDNDSVMTARLERDLNLVLGQHMAFEVKSANASLIALTPLFENTSKDPNLTKALDAASLPVTDKTLAMVSGLMEEGMPIDKATLQSLNRDMTAFPEAALRDVIALHKLNLPVTEENLNQMENYRNMEYRLLQGIERIAGEISETVLGMADTPGEENAAARLFFELWNALDGGREQTETENAVLRDMTGAPEGTGKDKTAADGRTDAGNAQHGGKIVIAEAGLTALENSASPEKTALAEGSAGEGERAAGTAGTAEAVMEQSAAETENAAEGYRDGKLADILPKAERLELAEQLRNLGLTEETAAQVSRGTMAPEELMRLLGKAALSGEPGARAFKSLLSGRGMKALLKGKIEQNFLLRPEQVADKREVEQLYERIREQTGKLARLLADAGKGDTALAKSVSALRENVDFINQLNQTFSYVQIPLKLAGRNAHGDLYVYTKKKNLAGGDGSVSALLHLDMENLGTVDVYVAMKRDKVSTKFYLQNEEMMDFMEKNIHLLGERLLKRGYTMNAEVFYREKPARIVEELTRQEGGASLMSKFSFDVRA